MNLDADICYRAIESRDRRFEGRFVVAVSTTGVYCRPGCPARIPKRRNVRFFLHAAAAETEGFRACKRCRPDASPETPAWNGTSTTVARAVRMISEGALDDAGIDGLAARLGVGARHLRRLFDEHLGASPIALAQTRRLHFAKRLLEETALPMTDVAHGAGFGSLRRFNDSFRKTFQVTPGAIRRDSPSLSRGQGNDSIVLRLPYKPPFDAAALFGFLRARATPGVETVPPPSGRGVIPDRPRAIRLGRVNRREAGDAIDSLAWRRTFQLGGTAGIVEARPLPGENAIALEVRAPLPLDLMAIAERVRRVFDLGADVQRIEGELSRDPFLAKRIRPGTRVPGAWDAFELCVRAILGQQVSVAGATTTCGRLVAAYGERLPGGGAAGGLDRLFPSPAALAGARIPFLPKARAAAIRGLARAVAEGTLDLGSADAAARLEELPGIGPWTAQYVAMRALGETDAFPASDLGLKKALGGASEADVLRRAERWRPWRSYAAIHLWRTLE